MIKIGLFSLQIYCQYSGPDYQETMLKFPSLSALCFLVAKGGFLEMVNKAGKTASDIIGDPVVAKFLQDFVSKPPTQLYLTATKYCILGSNPISSFYRFQSCGDSTDLFCSFCGPKVTRCNVCRAPQPAISNVQPDFGINSYPEFDLVEYINNTEKNENGIWDSELTTPGSVLGDEDQQQPPPDQQEYQWKILPRSSRKRTDLLADGLGNTYTMRPKRNPNSSTVWQCSKKSTFGRNNKCPVVVKQTGNNFRLSKGPHQHFANTNGN